MYVIYTYMLLTCGEGSDILHCSEGSGSIDIYSCQFEVINCIWLQTTSCEVMVARGDGRLSEGAESVIITVG